MPTENRPIIYNIHGIYMSVEHGAVAESKINLDLNYFEIQEQKYDNMPDIQIIAQDIHIDKEQKHLIGHSMKLFSCENWKILKDNKVTLGITDCYRIKVFTRFSFSPYILIQMVAVPKAMTLIHAACISRNGDIFLFPGERRSGKTALISKLLKYEDVKFLGDDFVILSDDGMVYNFPLPFCLSCYHKPLFPHVFQRKRRVLFKGKFLSSIKTLKKIIKPISANYPVIEAQLRNISPEYMLTPVSEIVSKSKICEKGNLLKVIFLKKSSISRMVVEKADKEDLIVQMVSILQYELGMSSLWKYFSAMSSCRMLNLDDYYDKIYSILKASLGNAECYRLLIPEKFDITEMETEVKKIMD